MSKEMRDNHIKRAFNRLGKARGYLVGDATPTQVRAALRAINVAANLMETVIKLDTVMSSQAYRDALKAVDAAGLKLINDQTRPIEDLYESGLLERKP